MRRVIFLVVVCFLLTACNVRNSGNIGNIFVKKVNNLDSYYLAGDLVLRNNDEVYTYQVEVSFEKKSNYKVLLTNKANNLVAPQDFATVACENPKVYKIYEGYGKEYFDTKSEAVIKDLIDRNGGTIRYKEEAYDLNENVEIPLELALYSVEK